MITYRFAVPNDFDQIVELLQHIDKKFPIPLSEKTNLDELTSKFLKNGHVYLALEGNIPVGIVGFYANDIQTTTGYISVVGVVEAHQRMGIAKELVNQALLICKNRGMTFCVLHTHKKNNGAISLYKKLGFVGEENPNRPQDIKFVKRL